MSSEKRTECQDCGTSIEYVTKKPKRCPACRREYDIKHPNPYRRKRAPEIKNTSGEIIMFRALDEIITTHGYINHGYYSFLMSPKNSPMQLDRFYPELRLAFEFDGKPHDTYSEFLHGSREDYEYYKECDRLKEEICRKHNITLIRVAWNHKITPDALKIDIKKHNQRLYEYLFKK